MKYIIKNCECKGKGKTTLCVRDIPYKKCKNITDCLLKRIADKCCYKSPDGGFNDSEAQDLANEILELLEIEEYKNE